jgi:hypothetical protein
VHEWLSEIGIQPPPDPAPELRVTYHESCHLAHGQKIAAEPRQLAEGKAPFAVYFRKDDLLRPALFALVTAEFFRKKRVGQGGHVSSLLVVGRAAVPAFDIFVIEHVVALFSHAGHHFPGMPWVHAVIAS